MELVVLGKMCLLLPMEQAGQLPLYLTGEYDFYHTNICGKACIVFRYKGIYLSAQKVQKQMKQVQKYTNQQDVPCVLWTNSLRREQMEQLIERGVPFYVSQWQMYLPFLGTALLESQEREEALPKDRFTVSEQCVFLAVLLSEEPVCSVAVLMKRLSLSRASVSRALSSLHSRGLLTVQGKATRKVYSRPDRRSFWEKGREAMISPVMRRLIYRRENLPAEHVCLAGESALAAHTMLAEPSRIICAVGKHLYDKLPPSAPEEEILSNEGDAILEIWRYDPSLFSQKGDGGRQTADPFSLYAALGELRREDRIELELEGWMEAYFSNAGN